MDEDEDTPLLFEGDRKPRKLRNCPKCICLNCIDIIKSYRARILYSLIIFMLLQIGSVAIVIHDYLIDHNFWSGFGFYMFFSFIAIIVSIPLGFITPEIYESCRRRYEDTKRCCWNCATEPVHQEPDFDDVHIRFIDEANIVK